MKKESLRLKENIESTCRRYCGTDEAKASVKLSEDKWSIKEIFGHLVDSAANNYQRFMRLQEADLMDFPGYDYNWIKIVPYQSYPFQDLMQLWTQFNRLLCHIIDNMDESRLKHQWFHEGDPLTLEFLVKDYNDHMEIHLEQLEERLAEVHAASGMTNYRAVKSYDEAPDNPISLKAGEEVSILEESDPEGDWPNWLFCKVEGKEGWVPKQIIESRGEKGRILEDYYAREFNLAPGDIIIGEKELNGWVWGLKKGSSDSFGWAPLNCLEKEY